MPDFERADQQMEWELTLRYTDNGSGVIDDIPIKISLVQIWEEMVSFSDIPDQTVVRGPDSSDVTLEYVPSDDLVILSAKESDDLEIEIPIDLYSPDSEEYQLYWKFEPDWNQSYYFSGIEDAEWVPIKLSFFNQTREDYDSIDLTAKTGTASFNRNDKSLSKPWNNDDDGYALIEFTDVNFSSLPDMPVKLSLWAVPGDDLGSGGILR